MSVENVVQYESHSLKQYTRGSETEITKKAGVGIKMGSAQYNQEDRKQQEDSKLENWKVEEMNGQHLRQTRGGCSQGDLTIAKYASS